MELTPQAYYAILQAHDRRFDGLFFVCVLTTKIYCRPICPTHPPLARNCTYRKSSAEAERDGFRPCMRCRPERAPRIATDSTAADSVASQVASYIDETLLMDETLKSVSERYEITDRHIRRLFKETYGIEPRQYVTTQRLLFAKQLLQDTTMPIAQVAYAAGFGSPGRLTAQMKKMYNFTPQKLRRIEKPKNAPEQLILRADYRPPFAWEELLAFLAGRATPNEWTSEHAYHRIVDGHEIIVTHDATKNCVLVHIPAQLSRQAHTILVRVRAVFDLSANPLSIASHLSSDPLLKPLVSQYPGLRVPGCWDDFEMLLRVVVGQQVSVAGATTVMRRLVDTIGATPQAIAASSPEAIVKLGMPYRRATTLWTLGVMVQNGTLKLDEPDPKKFYDTLVAIAGIGPWTAEYLSMRVRDWPDSFPAGDLALQKALFPGRRITEKQLIQHAELWRPWRSYATVLLWRSLHNNGG